MTFFHADSLQCDNLMRSKIDLSSVYYDVVRLAQRRLCGAALMPLNSQE